MTNEFFATTAADGTTTRLPFPLDVPLDERDAYMAATTAAEPPAAVAPAPTPDED